VPNEHYKKLLNENMTKTNKKANKHLHNKIIEEAKLIATNLGLANQVKSLEKI